MTPAERNELQQQYSLLIKKIAELSGATNGDLIRCGFSFSTRKPKQPAKYFFYYFWDEKEIPALFKEFFARYHQQLSDELLAIKLKLYGSSAVMSGPEIHS